MLLVCGRRATASLWTITPGRPAFSPDSKRSRSAVSCGSVRLVPFAKVPGRFACPRPGPPTPYPAAGPLADGRQKAWGPKYTVTNNQCPNAQRSLELVCRNAQGRDAQPAEVDWQLACCRDRIGVQRHSGRTANGRQLLDWLHHARLVVGQHHADQARCTPLPEKSRQNRPTQARCLRHLSSSRRGAA